MFPVAVRKVQLVRESTMWADEGKTEVSSSENAKHMFKQFFDELACPQEVFAVMVLDTKNIVTGISKITMGTLDSSLVHPREVFRYALLEGASSIILGHNHPSGNPTPSQQDIAVTDRLKEVGNLIGIDVLDHIVVGDHAVSISEYRS